MAHTAPTVPLVLHRTMIIKCVMKKFGINCQWRSELFWLSSFIFQWKRLREKKGSCYVCVGCWKLKRNQDGSCCFFLSHSLQVPAVEGGEGVQLLAPSVQMRLTLIRWISYTVELLLLSLLVFLLCIWDMQSILACWYIQCYMQCRSIAINLLDFLLENK